MPAAAQYFHTWLLVGTMPYKKKGVYSCYKRENPQETISLVRAGDLSLRKAAARFSVPKSTLADYVSG